MEFHDMESNKKNVPVLSVKKALDLLEMLIFQDVKRNGIRLSDLAAKLEIPDNTARNLLKTMVECGFVAQNSESRYITGNKCRQIGILNKFNSESIRNAIREILNKFNKEVDETIVFAILSDGCRETIDRVDSKIEVRVVYDNTIYVNIFETSTGRILAAYCKNEELSKIIERYDMPGERWNNIEDLDKLKKELALIKEKGYVAMSRWNLLAFACPVLSADGALIGSIGCYVPVFRCPRERQPEIIRALKNVASDLTRRLS
jgi:IclR family acetate operon transcriptional repressor